MTATPWSCSSTGARSSRPRSGEVEGFELWWTDHVANEWSETYPTLALAVVRLGVLIAASDTRRSFADVPREFVRRVEDLGLVLSTFVDDRLDPP